MNFPLLDYNPPFSYKKEFQHKNKLASTQKYISLCSEEVKWQNQHWWTWQVTK